MRWNLRMTAAERGIWKSTEMRRRLADAGLEISAGKMSALWTGTPTTIRLEDLDVICAVLDCNPTDLLICEPDKVAARRPRTGRRSQRLGGEDHTPAGSQPQRASGVRGGGQPRPCQSCGLKARAERWGALCHDCMPGGPFMPPPCRNCGTTKTSTQAIVRPLPPLRTPERRLLPGLLGLGRDPEPQMALPAVCIAWTRKYPVGACQSCHQAVAVNKKDICRLCWRNASGTY